LAALIAERTGVEASLVAAGRGIFDVVVNGTLMFSKHQTGHFPDHETLVADILALAS